MGQLNVSFDDALLAEIDRLAAQRGINRPELLRALVREAIGAEGKVGDVAVSPSQPESMALAPELVGQLIQMSVDLDRVLRDMDRREARLGKALVASIWSAVAGMRLSYALPPASFERVGQKIRTPSQILEGKVATCLDTTLLFAAALEQASLNPLIIFIKGHAFVGVWLQVSPAMRAGQICRGSIGRRMSLALTPSGTSPPHK